MSFDLELLTLLRRFSEIRGYWQFCTQVHSLKVEYSLLFRTLYAEMLREAKQMEQNLVNLDYNFALSAYKPLQYKKFKAAFFSSN